MTKIGEIERLMIIKFLYYVKKDFFGQLLMMDKVSTVNLRKHLKERGVDVSRATMLNFMRKLEDIELVQNIVEKNSNYWKITELGEKFYVFEKTRLKKIYGERKAKHTNILDD